MASGCKNEKSSHKRTSHKSGLSDGGRARFLLSVVGYGFDSPRNEGYLGNVGLSWVRDNGA